MQQSVSQRYGDVAVIFHWLIAFLIIGLLAVGKYMTSLEPDDPVRFQLTQWHKSFGLTVLFLSVLRLLWRFTHRPPADLANVITIPHLPPFDQLPNKAQIAEAFHEYHELASHILIAILLAHIGAALKHHIIDKDVTLVRMLPDWASDSFKTKIAALTFAIGGSTVALMLYAASSNQAALLAAGDSEVSFIADVSGDLTPGIFSDSSVTASIDTENPGNSSIIAVVTTASLSSGNPQVAGSLPDPEWFDVAGHPEARFESTAIIGNDDGTLSVDGNLTIKTNTQSVSFIMTLSEEEGAQVARGEFVIDRRDFDVGMESQGTDEYVGYDVTVQFRFDIGQSSEDSAS